MSTPPKTDNSDVNPVIAFLEILRGSAVRRVDPDSEADQQADDDDDDSGEP